LTSFLFIARARACVQENAQMFRMTAYRLMQAGQWDMAIEVLENVLRVAPAEPHSSLDVGTALLHRFFTNVATKTSSKPSSSGKALDTKVADVVVNGPPMVDFDRAVSLLLDVVVNEVDSRFTDVEVVALMELNRAIARRGQLGLGNMPATALLDLLWQKIGADSLSQPANASRPNDSKESSFKSFLTNELGSSFGSLAAAAPSPAATTAGVAKAEAKRSQDFSGLFQMMEADVRVKMQWDTDLTDQALAVTEPHGEHVLWNHQLSDQGGYFFRDFTRGYGPEEYICQHGRKGRYNISVKYWANNGANLVGDTTLLFTIYTNWSRPNEQVRFISVVLKKDQQPSSSSQTSISDFTQIGNFNLS
jgi:Uncharacterized protein conserved in bacteria (DUF2135)